MKLLLITGPYRVDLSGRPYGFLLIWKPRDYPLKWQPPYEAFGPNGESVMRDGFWFHDAPSRFAPIQCAWSIGVSWYPWWKHAIKTPLLPKLSFAVGHPA